MIALSHSPYRLCIFPFGKLNAISKAAQIKLDAMLIPSTPYTKGVMNNAAPNGIRANAMTTTVMTRAPMRWSALAISPSAPRVIRVNISHKPMGKHKTKLGGKVTPPPTKSFIMAPTGRSNSECSVFSALPSSVSPVKKIRRSGLPCFLRRYKNSDVATSSSKEYGIWIY